MYQTLDAPSPVEAQSLAGWTDGQRTPAPAAPFAEPVVPKLRGVPLIVTWVVLAGAPWIAVWQLIKHTL